MNKTQVKIVINYPAISFPKNQTPVSSTTQRRKLSHFCGSLTIKMENISFRRKPLKYCPFCDLKEYFDKVPFWKKVESNDSNLKRYGMITRNDLQRIDSITYREYVLLGAKVLVVLSLIKY